MITPLLAFGLLLAQAAGAPAESTAELFEKGIYAEETQGDLPAAIEIYKKIAAVAEAERPTAARALLRLGLCYSKSGRGEQAAATFQKLRAEYPEQKAVLADVPAPAIEGPRLEPAPWASDESLVYRSSGYTFALFRAREVTLGTRTVTRLDNYHFVASTRVDVDPATFRPLTYRHRWAGWHPFSIEGIYSAARLDIVRSEKDSVTREPLQLDGAEYDVESLVHLIRRLPLREGYRLPIRVAWPGHSASLHSSREDDQSKARVLAAVIDVPERRSIGVPAGEFDCYGVDIRFPDESVPTQRLWYSADAHRYLVRHDGGPAAPFELAQIISGPLPRSLVRLPGAAAYNGRAIATPAPAERPFDVSGVTVPEGWLALDTGRTSPHIRLVSLEGLAYGTIQRERLPPGKEKAEDFVEASIVEGRAGGEGAWTSYNAHKTESVTVCGFPAATLISSTVRRTRGPIVSHIAFIVHGQHRSTLDITGPTPMLETLGAVFRPILQSLECR